MTEPFQRFVVRLYPHEMTLSFHAPGIIRPFVGDPTTPGNMSPHRVTVSEFCARFATSIERIKILQGLLDHRAALAKFGLTGWQWLAGSFVEDIETFGSRPPKDIDIVNFLQFPAMEKDKRSAINLELHKQQREGKAKWKCDLYYIPLDQSQPAIADQTSYWLSLFGHSRHHNNAWKGIARVPLDVSDDTAGAAILTKKEVELAKAKP